MSITIGSTLPKIVRVKANAAVSFFIPKILDNIARSVYLQTNEYIDLNQIEVLELGDTLAALIRKQIIEVETIGQANDAEDVAYAPLNTAYYNNQTTIILKEALDRLTPSITTQTTNYTILDSFYGTLFMDTTSGPLTATLFTAVGNASRILCVKNIGPNPVTLDTVLSQTIDGLPSLVFGPTQSRTVQTNGVNWFVI